MNSNFQLESINHDFLKILQFDNVLTAAAAQPSKRSNIDHRSVYRCQQAQQLVVQRT